MDWATVKTELNKPLAAKAVKERTQAGRTLNYIEGWHAIAEANRIFGFNGWTRETLEIKCVSERPRKIGKPPHERDGWGVSYTAKVRVTVDGVPRDGVGAGHGIDADVGQAHESAIKEAETDAMKRALMTFGNPFGLALYDKTQANVADEPEEPRKPVGPSPAYTKHVQSLYHTNTLDGLKTWSEGAQEDGGDMTDAEWRDLTTQFKARKAQLLLTQKEPA